MRAGQLVLAFVIAAVPTRGAAQAVGEAAAGEHVRLRRLDGAVVTGRLAAPLDPNTATVAICPLGALACPRPDSSSIVRAPLNELARIEVRRGAHVGRGALIGASIVALGTVLTLATWESADSPGPSTTGWVVGTAGAAAFGASVGAILGSTAGRWRRIR